MKILRNCHIAVSNLGVKSPSSHTVPDGPLGQKGRSYIIAFGWEVTKTSGSRDFFCFFILGYWRMSSLGKKRVNSRYIDDVGRSKKNSTHNGDQRQVQIFHEQRCQSRQMKHKEN